MTTTRALTTDPRKAALDDCANKIRINLRRGLEATCAIARELYKIKADKLYEVAGYKDYDKYLEDEFEFSDRTARRITQVSQTCFQLLKEGLQLPDNESQVTELSRVEEPLRPRFWNNLLIQYEKEEKPLTADAVRYAVDDYLKSAPAAPQSSGGIEVEMPDSSSTSSNGSKPGATAAAKPQVQEGQVVLSEKGEAALARIRKVCGDEVAQAIEEGTKAMTERDIKAWADYDNGMMKTLTYYLFDRNWTLTKAVNFANKDIEDSTDVADLLLIARARGGFVELKVGKAKITVEVP